MYETRRFITAFTRACHTKPNQTCPCSQQDQLSLCSHPNSWKSILILSSHLFLGLPNGLFLSGLTPKPCMHLSCLPYVPHTLPISLFLIWPPDNIWWGDNYAVSTNSVPVWCSENIKWHDIDSVLCWVWKTLCETVRRGTVQGLLSLFSRCTVTEM